MPFKNTVLLILFSILSCTGFQKNHQQLKEQDKGDTYEKKDIITGANQLEAYLPLLKNKTIGIVANQTSVIFKNDNTYIHLVDSLLNHEIIIKKVFAPEHGFRGKADAGEKVKDSFDRKTNIPIQSLYGKNRKPTLRNLKGIDIMVFDIQDVGVRFYTYLSTMHLVMEACAENNIPVIVLDRPNPNGSYVDGPTMKKEHTSFLGMHSVPLVYGMTIGEYAKMIVGEKWLKNEVQCDLTVIPLKNYSHQKEYHLPIKPSPNLPNDHAINLYPSLGLFEGTNINAGRGTDFQFQIYGAPFLDTQKYDYTYTPVANEGAKYPKHKGQLCYGNNLRNAQKTKRIHLKWLIDAYTNTVDKTKFFNTASFTKHAGTEILQKQIENTLSEEEIRKSWRADLNKFKKIRMKYLLYDD